MFDEIWCPWCGHTVVYKSFTTLRSDVGQHQCALCLQLFRIVERVRVVTSGRYVYRNQCLIRRHISKLNTIYEYRTMKVGRKRLKKRQALLIAPKV